MLRGVSSRTPFLILALALGLVWAPATARGDATAEAQRLLTAGIAHYSNGQFHEAIALLKEAADKAPKPALLARIHAYLGVNYFVTNQREKAQAAFSTALKHDPSVRLEVKEVGASIQRFFDATRKGFRGSLRVAAGKPGLTVHVDGQKMGKAPWEGSLSIGAHRLRLETEDGIWHCEEQVVIPINAAAVATCKLQRYKGKLLVITAPSGAAVLMEKGRSLGQAPLQVALEAGQHKLRVRLAGHVERPLTIIVRRGRTTRLQVRLKRSPKKPMSRRAVKTLLAYSSLGVGLALLSGAAVLYGTGASEGGDAHDKYYEATLDKDYESSRKAIESARSKLVVGHVLAGAALAAVGFSVYNFVTRPREEAPSGNKRALSITPTQGGAVFSVGGKF